MAQWFKEESDLSSKGWGRGRFIEIGLNVNKKCILLLSICHKINYKKNLPRLVSVLVLERSANCYWFYWPHCIVLKNCDIFCDNFIYLKHVFWKLSLCSLAARCDERVWDGTDTFCLIIYILFVILTRQYVFFSDQKF